VKQVLTAPSQKEAAAVIAGWHHDWGTVADSPTAAARRIRPAGRAIASPKRRACAAAPSMGTEQG
jgi:hypothetical protein